MCVSWRTLETRLSPTLSASPHPFPSVRSFEEKIPDRVTDKRFGPYIMCFFVVGTKTSMRARGGVPPWTASCYFPRRSSTRLDMHSELFRVPVRGDVILCSVDGKTRGGGVVKIRFWAWV